MEWTIISWVARGRLRQRVLSSLDQPKTATMIAKQLETHRSTVSQILGELEQHKLVICKDNDAPYNRFFEITKKGKEVSQKLKRIVND